MALPDLTAGQLKGGTNIAGNLLNFAGIEAQDSASKMAYREAFTTAASMETALAQRELDRKNALLSALASQNAMAGASGVQLSGSLFDTMGQDIASQQEASLRDKFNTDIQRRVLLTRAKAQRKMEKGAKNLSLFANTLDMGANVTQMMMQP